MCVQLALFTCGVGNAKFYVRRIGVDASHFLSSVPCARASVCVCVRACMNVGSFNMYWQKPRSPPKEGKEACAYSGIILVYPYVSKMWSQHARPCGHALCAGVKVLVLKIPVCFYHWCRFSTLTFACTFASFCFFLVACLFFFSCFVRFLAGQDLEALVRRVAASGGQEQRVPPGQRPHVRVNGPAFYAFGVAGFRALLFSANGVPGVHIFNGSSFPSGAVCVRYDQTK